MDGWSWEDHPDCALVIQCKNLLHWTEHLSTSRASLICLAVEKQNPRYLTVQSHGQNKPRCTDSPVFWFHFIRINFCSAWVTKAVWVFVWDPFVFSKHKLFVTDRSVTVSAIVACLLKTFFLTAVCQAQREKQRESCEFFSFYPSGRCFAQRGCCGGMLQSSRCDQNRYKTETN